MKHPALFVIATFTLLILPACDSSKKSTADEKTPEVTAPDQPDVPILPARKGDVWIYEVRLEIPADITSPGAVAVDETHQRTRTYLGKIAAAKGLPEVDCFEVSIPGFPSEREFVDILNDRILMRGSLIMRPETTQPVWLDHAIPFVIAGMKPGTETPEIQSPGGALSRKIQVIAREDIKVPAGTFPAIRLLMTGMDGDLEIRRTIWFSPKTGIVREEKSRYRLGKLIFRETQQLVKTSIHENK